jgi:RHS repeat-associated protein
MSVLRRYYIMSVVVTAMSLSAFLCGDASARATTNDIYEVTTAYSDSGLYRWDGYTNGGYPSYYGGLNDNLSHHTADGIQYLHDGWYIGNGVGGIIERSLADSDNPATVEWGPGCEVNGYEGVNPTDPQKEHTTEPVNILNGNMLHDEMDIVIPCPGISLGFSRHYNSSDSYVNSGFGSKWSHSYEWCVDVPPDDSVDVWAGDRCKYTLSIYGVVTNSTSTNRIWRGRHDTNWELRETTNNEYNLYIGGGSYLLYDTNGIRTQICTSCQSPYVYGFDTNGILKQISDPWQNSVTLLYSNGSPSLVTNIHHSNGQYLNLSYGISNRIVRVDTPNPSFYVAYSYNSSAEMTNATRFTSSGAFPVKYSYDASSNHCLTQVVNAAGDVFAYAYSTNALGQSLAACTGMVLNADYYRQGISCFTNQHRSSVTYFRGNSNQIYSYYYVPNTLQITNIYGPCSSNLVTSRYYDNLYLNLTNEIVADNSLGESVRTLTWFDDRKNVVTQGVAYCATPSNFWRYGWNQSSGVITNVTDPEGNKTGFEYTNATISRARLYYNSSNSYDTFFSYTTNGFLSRMTNANGHWTQFSYDSYGRLSHVTPQVGPSVWYSNNILGYTTKIMLPSDVTDTNDPPNMITRDTVLDRDELGQIKKITYPGGLYDTFAWDAVGNVTNHIDTAGRTTSYTYLPTRKLSSVTRQLGTSNLTTSFVYDNQFNTLTIKDAKNRAVESYTLDIQDRPVTVTNLEGQTMTVTYGVGSYVRKLSRFDGTTVTNMFNGDGWLSNVKYPGTTNVFTYTSAGRPLTLSNEVAVISNSWQQTGWLNSSRTAMKSGPTATVTYAYLPAGNISNVTSVAGTNTYGYNGAEQISSITAIRSRLSSPLTFNYSYNSNNGLVSAMTCTNTGITASYSFDDLDRVTHISWACTNGDSRTFDYSRNNAGMITSVVREDGEWAGYGYDDLDRLTNAVSYAATGTIISAESFAFDEVGNRTSKVINGIPLSYSYPYGTNGNRLASWIVTQTNLTAQLDVYGSANEPIGTNPRFGQLWVSNKVAVTPFVDGTNFWVYDLTMNLGTQKIVAAIRDVAGNTTFKTNTVTLNVITNGTYSYSAAGCVTNIRYRGAASTRNTGLTWDGKYQLTAVTTNGASVERNGFDALGRRVWTWDGTTTNYMIYDGSHVIAEVNATGALQRAYVYGPGIDNILATTVHTGATVKSYFYLTDHLGTVHAIADGTGTIVESYRFDAWGRVIGVYDVNNNPLTQSTIGNRYLWQGREYSWKTSLYFFRARWYDPITGRWLSNDPIGISGGLNQYVAFLSNPVNFRDPLGLWNQGMFWRGVAGLGANVVGAAVGYVGAETGAGLALGIWCSANAGVQAGNIINSFRDGPVPAAPGAVSLISEYGQTAVGSNNRFVRGAANITDLAGPMILSGQIDWSRVSGSAVNLLGLPTTAFTRAAVDPTVAYPWVNVFQSSDAGLLIWDQGSSIYNQIMNQNGNSNDTCK